MRHLTKSDLYLGAAGATLWAAVFLLPASPRAMPLGALEAVAKVEEPTPMAKPIELPPWCRRGSGWNSGVA